MSAEQNSSHSLRSQEESSFQPFIPASNEGMPEFSVKAFVLGMLCTVFFGMASVYLALRVGITPGGSIPISVLAIALFKRFGKSTILENNLVQTIGSAGESIATVTIYTVPAFLFLEGGTRYFHYPQLLMLAAAGGLLGILFMIPLRRSLIVNEHRTLRYPEGTACAEVLIAGEKQGASSKPIFWGSITAGIYWLLMRLAGLWKEDPTLFDQKPHEVYRNASLSLSVTPEYLGLGYVIGLRGTLQMLAGGLLAWLVLVPLFSYFPQLGTLIGAHDVPTTLQELFKKAPGSIHIPPIGEEIHTAYVKCIAVGLVVGAGVIALLRTMPVIVGSMRTMSDSFRNRFVQHRLRTEKNLPAWIAFPGALCLVLLVVGLSPKLPGTFPLSLMFAGIVVVFGFFFVTVSSRFVGVAGYSIEPITPMTFTTVIATASLMLLFGLKSPSYQLMIIPVAAMVCIAAGNAGATSQDLKTGFLVGATPYKQQLGLILGVCVSALVVSLTILLLDHSYPSVAHAIGTKIPETGKVELSALQARLLAMFITGLFDGKMPWGMVLVGVLLAILIESMGFAALSVAIGLYLPISVTSCLAVGGFIRWLVTRKQRQPVQASSAADAELSRGMLFATGLIAGGAIVGMLLGFFTGFFRHVAATISIGKNYWERLTWLEKPPALAAFFVLLGVLYVYARDKKKNAIGI